ncbi:MAG: carboxypeptidase M32 [Rhodothermales bacterium]|nr:carboxypeptidase M32 [Rhodothermales bacterium]MBO6779391.1 carboxypeptidase M32 [Rhodothermales bacterium]
MEDLRRHLGRIADLNAAAAVLEWDMETHMPDAGVAARARQIGTLREFAHELHASDETGAFLAAAVPSSAVDQDLLRVAKRDFELAMRMPAELVGEMARVTSLARDAWKTARERDDFPAFAPHLEAVIDCNRRKAEALGYDDDPYDALLDEFEPGMKTARVSQVFADLRTELVELVAAIAEKPAHDDALLGRYFPPDRQWDLGEQVMAEIGYDFSRGRQDKSAHPFSTTFSVTDSRVTTHVHPHHFNPAFFGSLHEAGHAMYEQGVDEALDGTPLASGTSLGMHESQSRLWENLVGRSRAFWDRYFPVVQAYFPGALAQADPDGFYRAINTVRPSLIRIESDEVTYNLHIMLRFELERAMLSGDVPAADLPEAWNARMQEYLGIVPPSDAAGCLQDIHWSLGAIGYFPTYSLGNLMSAQLWEAMGRDCGDLDEHIRAGRFSVLLDWLRENVHRHGRRKTASEILLDATGSDLDAGPWMAYAKAKFGALYEL